MHPNPDLCFDISVLSILHAAAGQLLYVDVYRHFKSCTPPQTELLSFSQEVFSTVLVSSVFLSILKAQQLLYLFYKLC